MFFYLPSAQYQRYFIVYKEPYVRHHTSNVELIKACSSILRQSAKKTNYENDI